MLFCTPFGILIRMEKRTKISGVGVQRTLGTSAILMLLLLSACQGESGMESTEVAYDASQDTLWFEGEGHLRNIRQLTFGGNNAEAYWSFDDSELVFQSDWSEINTQGCDQIYTVRVDGSLYEDGARYRQASTGRGRTTCGYFLADGRIIYSSTHAVEDACPAPPPAASGRYVWPIYSGYDIYVFDPATGTHDVLIGGPGYDAEPTVSPDGRFVIFTSTRGGDLDLYRFEVETGEVIQLTETLGYDGGAFFSRDSQRIVWRASRPTGAAADQYQALLSNDVVEPGALNIFVANADGSDVRQITDIPGANWAPFFHPDGERVLFSSNFHTLDEGGREFDIFMVDLNGENIEQITHSGTFDAFPMFSYDGTKIAFASNRRGDRAPSRDTNVFVADWVD